MKKGFTLIELLVVISIIGILVGLSLFGIEKTRGSSRDARRKADLEQIRSALEIYRSDCGRYPLSLSSPLKGTKTTSPCSTSDTYIDPLPVDPLDSERKYLYKMLTTTSYEVCAALEQGSGSVTCGGSSSCKNGTEAVTCNYKVINP